MVVWLVLIYGAECWALNKRDEKRLEVTEIIMLRRMLGVTRRDRLLSDMRRSGREQEYRRTL